MKLNHLILATGFVVTCTASYITGYHKGTNDTASALQPKLTELQAKKEESKKLMKEVELINHKVDDLRAKLSTPVILSTMDISYDNNVRVAKFKISAYSPYDDRNYINSDGSPNNTATGTTPRPGTFAVDPRVIPYGSRITILYPDGTVETGIAEDTGGAIKNNRIDVFRYTYESAMAFGMKDAVVMWQ